MSGPYLASHTALATFDSYQARLSETLGRLQRDNVIARIWACDHTVWQPDPREIYDRLGWLSAVETMLPHAGDLAQLAGDIRGTFDDVVVLGMGGSSLAPEVLRAIFGKRRGFPRLHVLDSTVPAWVRRVTRAVDPARTLFVVASKSGGTVEVLSLFKHFHALVAQAVAHAGKNFIAITDPGTSLEQLAGRHRFRRTFLNPPDIGGRYSALSHFGLVPAALAGVEVAELLERGRQMALQCLSLDPGDNPGARLGASLGMLAAAGRDKLTFITSPTVKSFGLWAEQLIAESTGKDAKGIVPVALEPNAPASAYGGDRVFAYLRLEGDDNAAGDSHADALEAAGHPLIRMALRDRYDLAAEFFRWEFATALAGALMGIHPFDQPNVQESKDNTASVLAEASAHDEIPATATTGTLRELLAQARPGDYVALMAYVDSAPRIDRALTALRAAILAHHHLPVTMGYGPRFLHSTGQLHKGGPNSGLFVQLIADWGEALPVPGDPYTFAGLAAAQVVGDYRSLVGHGRRVVRINLGRQPVAELRRLAIGLTTKD